MKSYLSQIHIKPIFLVGIVLLASAVTLISHVDASKAVLSEVDCIIEPSIVAAVGSSVPGSVESIYYERSDFVQTGSVMAELESGVEIASLNLAERIAQMTTTIALREVNAKFGARTHKRNKELFKKSSISSQSMDQVKTESTIARLQLLQEKDNQELAALDAVRARAALERRVIRSPFDGSITKRFKSVGEFVEGEPVFEIAQLDPLFVEVIVPLEYLGAISTGMRGNVRLNVPGFENKTLEASVRRIDSVADAASGTYGVRLELPNPDLKIPAGVRCQLDFLAD